MAAPNPMMAGANDVLETHRSRITNLYIEGRSEEMIADDLGRSGVETTHYDIYECLRRWSLIPSPSPVHSGDSIDSNDDRRQNPEDRLSVTCHHGEDSHASQSSLTRIPPDPTSIETYERDMQLHEDLAYGLQLPLDDAEHLYGPRRMKRLKIIYKILKGKESDLTFGKFIKQYSKSVMTDDDFLKDEDFSGDVRIPLEGRQNKIKLGVKRKRRE